MEKTGHRSIRTLITFYTDPLCCWSYAMAPALQELAKEFPQSAWRYCMGGLIPDWNNFNDPVNAVSRPIQMGPVWMHAAAIAGMHIDQNLWMRDPPSSSYPACVAVKAVGLQSQNAAADYLHLLWNACMNEGQNIARRQVLVEMAGMLADTHDRFHLHRFTDDIQNGKAKEAFRDDLQETRMAGIDRLPTIAIRHGQRRVLGSGYQSIDQVKAMIERVVAAAEK